MLLFEIIQIVDSNEVLQLQSIYKSWDFTYIWRVINQWTVGVDDAT